MGDDDRDGADSRGRRCGPSPEGGAYENVHVALRPRGERALGLVWGTVQNGAFDVFRAARLRLEDVDPALVEQALGGGGRSSAASG